MSTVINMLYRFKFQQMTKAHKCNASYDKVEILSISASLCMYGESISKAVLIIYVQTRCEVSINTGPRTLKHHVMSIVSALLHHEPRHEKPAFRMVEQRRRMLNEHSCWLNGAFVFRCRASYISLVSKSETANL